ncbi:hypothetical protein ADN00_04020 [Ornatilinea apprima]|uniref:Uncharacterized protein n=1 Tax=Ornatilinea apprima TaxID=1134406 RepID=A0A0P6X7Q4_9CHLR|nr:hypothetical protein ADN00_04020 [Ornatilinea apprima]
MFIKFIFLKTRQFMSILMVLYEDSRQSSRVVAGARLIIPRLETPACPDRGLNSKGGLCGWAAFLLSAPQTDPCWKMSR